MSNPCSNNQHGIKILLFTEISCLQVIYFVCISDPPDNEMQAMFEQFSQEKGRRGLNANEQLMRFNEQFPKFNIWCMFPIYFQPIFCLTIWCIGSICCPLYERGWVSLVCARTTQHLNSMCKPYWISKSMIFQVGGVSLRCGNTWQTLIYLFLGRHLPLFFFGYYI